MHRFEALARLTGKDRKAKKCGYCWAESAYLCCTTCFPDVSLCTYGICSPNTGKDCVGRHCAGEAPRFKGHKVKMPSPGAGRSPGSRADPKTSKRKKQARAAAALGGKKTQAAKRARPGPGGRHQ